MHGTCTLPGRHPGKKLHLQRWWLSELRAAGGGDFPGFWTVALFEDLKRG